MLIFGWKLISTETQFKAIKMMTGQVAVYIFSNDIASSHLSLQFNLMVVDLTSLVEKSPSFELTMIQEQLEVNHHQKGTHLNNARSQ